MTNVAKILLLHVFFNIRRKLFDFQTFMNETQIINSTDIIIYFTDTYYLYYGEGGGWVKGVLNNVKTTAELVFWGIGCPASLITIIIIKSSLGEVQTLV